MRDSYPERAGGWTMVAWQRVVPIVPARDTAASAAWWRDRFGFEVVHTEPAYGIVRRGDAELHFWGPSGIDPAESDTMLRVEVDDVASLHDACEEAGLVHPNGALGERPWGGVEFSVLDLDGHLVTFFGPH